MDTIRHLTTIHLHPDQGQDMYIVILVIHLSCAASSITFFVLRGVWTLQEREILQHPLVKVMPHVIDTVLLLSALTLTLLTDQYPFIDRWLTVKLFALISYIILGSIALKRAKTQKTRILTLTGAVLLFSYIVSVAYFHHPLGIFSPLVA